MSYDGSTRQTIMRCILSGAALSLAASAAIAGCSGSKGETTPDSSSTTSTTGNGGGTSSSTSTTNTGGSGGGGGSAPQKPADCVDLPLTGIELVSPQENLFDSSDSVPIVRTPSSLANIAGGADLFDRMRILFDGATGTGVHALDPDPSHALPDYAKTYVTTCSACVVYQEDQDEGTGDYQKVFASKAGTLEITDLLTPHQTAGAARHVELREIAADPVSGAYAWVPGGACYWIEEAKYDVRRPNGCRPFVAGACPSDQYCMPTNASGTDGECVTGGAKAVGEACARADTTHWDSDCQLGLRCLNSACLAVCDIFSATPGCPAGTHCGGGYNVCLDVSVLMQSGIDDAAVGSPCATNPDALYCGGSGRPGICYDDDTNGPKPSTCRPWVASPSQCAAPETAGFAAYKNGIDNSTLWCLTPP